MFEKVRLIVNLLDAQAFAPSVADQDRVEFAALYTLQHGLPGDAEQSGCILHHHVAYRAVLDEAAAQRVGDANTPGCARRCLFPGDESVVDPAV